MKILATRKAEQNVAALDPWSVVHFAAGLAAGLMALPLSRSLGAAVGYEVVEQVLERHDVGRRLFATTRPEGAANVAADLLVFAAGHRLGELWHRTGG